MKNKIIVSASAIALAVSCCLSVAFLSLPSVQASAAEGDSIRIATSNAGVDLQAMFDQKAKDAGCEGLTLKWLEPRSRIRLNADADPYSDFRFLQAVPYHGDIYLYYYASAMGSSDPYTKASVSYVDTLGQDGLYHDSFSTVNISQTPSDFGYFRKSVIRSAYTYSVGANHRFSLDAMQSDYSSAFVRHADSFEICWVDVADGQDPIAKTFTDSYVVVEDKKVVLDLVLFPGSWNYMPSKAYEDFWCFFKLGDGVPAMSTLKKVNVSYIYYSYDAHVKMNGNNTGASPIDDGRMMWNLYAGLYDDPNSWYEYLDTPEPDGTDVSFYHASRANVWDLWYENKSADQPVNRDVDADGVTTYGQSGTVTSDDWLWGHENLKYSFNRLQKLDDASLALTAVKADFQEWNQKCVKPFVDFCKEYRSDPETGVAYDYAIKINPDDQTRQVTSVTGGLQWFMQKVVWPVTTCHQCDQVRIMSLTFHNDLLGGDTTFATVDTPTDTTEVHITQPYTTHVNGLYDYLAEGTKWLGVALAALAGMLGLTAIAVGVVIVGQYFGWIKSSSTNRRLRRIERQTRDKGGR